MKPDLSTLLQAAQALGTLEFVTLKEAPKMNIPTRHITVLRRRLLFLQARPYDNTFDRAEISALTHVIAAQEQMLEPGQRIVCAALECEGDLILGARHYDDLMRKQIEWDNPGDWTEANQGFIDNHGTYLTREQAWNVAEEAGQIIRRVGGDGQKLYSENLY